METIICKCKYPVLNGNGYCIKCNTKIISYSSVRFQDKLQVGQKVKFNYWDQDKEQDMSGRGWVKEIDTDNDQIIIQTTRKLIWVQTGGVYPIF